MVDGVIVLVDLGFGRGEGLLLAATYSRPPRPHSATPTARVHDYSPRPIKRISVAARLRFGFSGEKIESVLVSW